MSSLGDVVHTLPTVTDLVAAGHQVTWVVEEAFAPIAQSHPGVSQVIPIAWRRWRKNLIHDRKELSAFWAQLREQSFDLVLDAQGLYKSAVVTRMARSARRAGLAADSAREAGAARFYNEPHSVAKADHAVNRTRLLAAQALGYEITGEPDFGLPALAPSAPDSLNCIFLHGTTWASKHWPEEYWAELVELACSQGAAVKLLWGDATEKARAQRLAAVGSDRAPVDASVMANVIANVTSDANTDANNLIASSSNNSTLNADQGSAEVWDRMPIEILLPKLAGADLVIGVDSGLTHLAAALGIPTLAIYGSTDSELTGVKGAAAVNIQADFACAPCRRRECDFEYPEKGVASVQPACYESITPDRVWALALQQCQRADRILPI